jgi:UDP-2,3-diacylglucosamine hydrolase
LWRSPSPESARHAARITGENLEEKTVLYFIADLHLSPRASGATACFTAFLTRIAKPQSRLYILGDLFDAWVGDEEIATHQEIIDALARAAQAGLRVGLLRGNRDFLLGEDFARAAQLTLLPDPYVLSTPHWQFVLTHGDALCTDDVSYQQFRAQVRDPAWQRQFLALSLAERQQAAAALREQSRAEKSAKPAPLMDVNPITTDDFLRAHGYATLIHGHTHRPDHHDHIVDGIHVERWVLGEWSQTEGNALLSREPQSPRGRQFPADDNLSQEEEAQSQTGPHLQTITLQKTTP